MPTVNAEVSVYRNKDGVRQRFGHSDEAGIGKTHRDIRILLHQLEHLFDVLSQIEGADDGATSEQRDKGRTAFRSQEVKCFR